MTARAEVETRAFDLLAPFIQEFIWNSGWSELRDIQSQAIHTLLDTDKHMILAASTASGKTEAAMFPILTDLFQNPPTSVGALYIGPLKALINDQFLRVNSLCEEANIPVTAWHGDANAGAKARLLKAPAGVLQITPESLEGILLNRRGDLYKLFHDLRWVVIDEVHAFMGSDRGGQVLSLLDRLAPFTRDRTKLPRRIGLSATLGEYGQAARWLAGDEANVEVVVSHASKPVSLLVENYTELEEVGSEKKEDNAAEAAGGTKPTPGEQEEDRQGLRFLAQNPALTSEVYMMTRRGKTLVFANTRETVESLTGALRIRARRSGGSDIYHPHHGNLSAEIREGGENAMREDNTSSCAIATTTLELGLDIGQLDRILQIGTTSTVSSFLQRLGRAGRHGGKAEMFFLIQEEPFVEEASALEKLPWKMLQAVAIIQLYRETKWVEPARLTTLPGSLLYQQTMSIIASYGELTPAQLAQKTLTLAPFKDVGAGRFRSLLNHLIETEHLEKTPENTLILGLAGEKLVRNFRFLATFADTGGWEVTCGGQKIGSIEAPVPPGETFMLAGQAWAVVALDENRKTILAERIRGRSGTKFTPHGHGDVHDRVVERVALLLTEAAVPEYLGTHAKVRMAGARKMAREAGLLPPVSTVSLGGNKYAILPWCGSRKLATLRAWLRTQGEEFQKIVTPRGTPYITLESTLASAEAVRSHLLTKSASGWDAMALGQAVAMEGAVRGKFEEFLPEDLATETFIMRTLDIEGAAQLAATLFQG